MIGVTTIEQSRRLLKLGVPAEKASLCWFEEMEYKPSKEQWLPTGMTWVKTWDSVVMPNDAVTPAFTVADLLGMMPKTLPSSRADRVLYLNVTNDGKKWAVSWVNHAILESIDSFGASDLISLLCERIEWLVANDYNLKL